MRMEDSMKISQASKSLIKREIDNMQRDKKKYQEQLAVAERDIAASQRRKREIQNQIEIIDKRTIELKKDIDAK